MNVDEREVSSWLKRWGVEHKQVNYSAFDDAFVAQDFVGYWHKVCSIPRNFIEAGEALARMAILCDECGAIADSLTSGCWSMPVVVPRARTLRAAVTIRVVWCERCFPEQQQRAKLAAVVELGFAIDKLAVMAGEKP